MNHPQFYGLFNEDGFLRALYPTTVFPDVVTFGETPEPTEDEPNPLPPETGRTRNPGIPVKAQGLTEDQYNDLCANETRRRWDPNTNTLVEYDPPPPPPVAVVVVVYKVDFYRRLTDDEAEHVEQAVAQQSLRQRRIFESANSFRSDAAEWATFEGLTVQLFGAERAAVLLAPSE